MLHDEGSLDAERRALLDRKGFFLERFEGAWSAEIDCDVRSILDFKGEGLYDAFPGIVWVADGLAGA
jgi:hypothetical protein